MSKACKLGNILVLLASTVGLSCSGAGLIKNEGDSLRIVSYNIRYNNPDDGENAWPNRKLDFIEKLREYDPDVLGVQEALHGQIQDLSGGLSNYSVVGQGRDDGEKAGEYCGIYFKNSKFELVDSGQFWLSPRPNEIASVGWDASLTRIATWVILKSLNDASELFVLNGHFDHRGSLARTESAKLIVQKTAELAGERKAIVLGDFNANPESDAYDHFVNSEEIFDLQDSFLSCTSREGSIGTFQGFAKRDDTKRRIDYIFTSEEISCHQYSAPADLIGGQRYYSDHLPVMIDISHK